MITACLRCGREKISVGGVLGKYEGEKTNFNYVFCPECVFVETALVESHLPNANMVEILKLCARDYRDKVVRDKNMNAVWVVNPDLPAPEVDMLFLEMKERVSANLSALQTGTDK